MKRSGIIVTLFCFGLVFVANYSLFADIGAEEFGFSNRGQNSFTAQSPNTQITSSSGVNGNMTSPAAGIGNGEFIFGCTMGQLSLVYINNNADVAKSAFLLNTPWKSWGGATNATSDDFFWATDSGAFTTGLGSALYRIYPAEGAIIQVGDGYGENPSDPNFYLRAREIGFDEDSQTLYGTNYQQLYTIDPNSGKLTDVGPFGIGFNGDPIDQVWSMDYDPNTGQLFIVDQLLDPITSARIGSHMYSVNTTTGAASNVGDTQQSSATDIYYSHLSNRMFGSDNAPYQFFNVNRQSGRFSQMSEIGHNMIGLGGGFAEQEGVPVTITGSGNISLCVNSQHGSTQVSDCDNSILFNPQASAAAFAQETGAAPGIGQTSTLQGQANYQMNSNHGFLNSQIDFDSTYNGTNIPGEGGGNIEINMSGSIRITTDGTYANGSRGLMLIVDGNRILNNQALSLLSDWYLKVVPYYQEDSPIIHLTDDDLPNLNSTPFMGAAYVLAGEWLKYEFHAEANLSPAQIIGDINNDGIVSLADASIVSAWWLSDTCSGSNDWCGHADLEPDGDVDTDDLSTTLAHWLMGKQGGSSLDLEHNFEFRTVRTPIHDGLLNDQCDDAVAVVENHRYLGTNIGATGTDITSCGYKDSLDVWYSFTPYRNGYYGVYVEARGFSPYYALFDSCGGNQLACDSGGGQIIFEGNAWTPYLIRVAGYNNSEGNFSLLVKYFPPPVNDVCDDAIEVFDGQWYEFQNFGAAGSSTSSCSDSDTRDVWYEYTPAYDGAAIIRTYSWSMDYDMTLSLYDSCDGSELACASTSYCDFEPMTILGYNVTGGQTYYWTFAKMVRTAQKDSETCKFRDLRFRKNVGYSPATPGAELCPLWHGSMCRKAHLCLKMP